MALKAYTENDPDVEVGGNLTLMLLVLFPEVMIAPGGTLQLYPVAPLTTFTEYIFAVSPWQTGSGPVINPGEGRQAHPKLTITVGNPSALVFAIASVMELQPQVLPRLSGLFITER